MSIGPERGDPREFALQLAIVAERLDERSARAVQRVEAVAAAFAAEVARMSDALAIDNARAVAAQQASMRTRMRASRMVSGSLLVVAVLAAAAAGVTVASAYRELGSVARDQALLDAINRADVTSCDGRLCARIDGDARGVDADGYRRIALRTDPAGP
ncbi:MULTISPECIES: hypothetical protein [unclassified Luteimonas]|uniref:hypothetical protein n=1 Tax=unclassified Luteimonas TaxID=2629088 RepID=UPI0018F0B7AB|nr:MULTISPECIES: hypothetical protein [unclassified Luteimonas]MBJ6980231.1 hypothetical protein [Luteimonas sp. MC1895]MBJ6985291.1 hypothetical protein [Luteimonas sp. MC1750]QQO05444.1 hypothetical protein JGR68_11470 [Luteimonas sp. MC1750]